MSRRDRMDEKLTSEQARAVLLGAHVTLRHDFPQVTPADFAEFCVDVLRRGVYGRRLKAAAMTYAEGTSPILR